MKAKFVSIWDDGIEIRSNCEYDKTTGEIYCIEVADLTEVKLLKREYIDFNGEEIEVCQECHTYTIHPVVDRSTTVVIEHPECRNPNCTPNLGKRKYRIVGNQYLSEIESDPTGKLIAEYLRQVASDLQNYSAFDLSPFTGCDLNYYILGVEISIEMNDPLDLVKHVHHFITYCYQFDWCDKESIQVFPDMQGDGASEIIWQQPFCTVGTEYFENKRTLILSIRTD